MNKNKVITEFWGKIDPKSLESYRKKGGYLALKQALRMERVEVVEEIKKSGLQGRGGAGFLAGLKWELAAKQKNFPKYFICNLDESEPGTYKDRSIAENNPHSLIEGIAIACYAVGAKEAFIYLNGNFKKAEFLLKEAIRQAKEKKYLGKSVMGAVFDLEIEVFVGAGAYICGEETALINSIEGKRGEPRKKPPFTCDCGLFDRSTVVNNAETIVSVPWIIQNSAEEFAKIGLPKCAGTKLFCVGGAVKNEGIYEAPIGITLRELIYDYAGGLQLGMELNFVQVGGSAGSLALLADLDEIPSYGQDAQIQMGSGAVLVMDKFQDVKKLMLSWARFFARESCGQCVPCREGTFRLKEIVERLNNGNFDDNDREDLPRIIKTLECSTFCALGKFSVIGIKDVLNKGLVKF